MWSFVTLVMAALVACCLSMPVTVKPIWKDCGKSANRSLFLKNFDVEPHPVELPGTITVNMLSENKHELTNMTLDLSIKRHIWRDYYIEIPCTNNYGSCVYKDLCGYLSNPPADAEEPMMKVKEMFKAAGHTLECPLQPAVLDITDVEHELPELPALVAMVAAGKYKIRAEFTDPRDDREIGCFELIIEAKEKPVPVEEEEYDYDDSCFFFC